VRAPCIPNNVLKLRAIADSAAGVVKPRKRLVSVVVTCGGLSETSGVF
jgi:hypothetical protein